MATQIEPKELNMQEQMTSIRRHLAEIDQRQVETIYEPRKFWLSAVVASSGLIVGTITLTKLFL